MGGRRDEKDGGSGMNSTSRASIKIGAGTFLVNTNGEQRVT